MKHYIDEIHQTHNKIERWLSQGEGHITDLMSRFTEDFSMITSSGKRLTYTELETFFIQLKAARPGLIIRLDHISLLQQTPHSAVILYQEQQQVIETTHRWSTAILTQQNGRPRWKYLQETLWQNCL